jgi:hypothetical protein
VIASWNSATIAPRLLTGTISAMYSGTTVDAKPMPRPMTSRATISTPRVGAAAARIAPTTNTTADSAMIRRRGRRVVSQLDASAPISAPSVTALTTIPMPDAIPAIAAAIQTCTWYE